MQPIAPVVVAGRLLLALIFIVAGYGKLTGLAGTAGYIASKGLPLPAVLAFGAGVLELVGGIALAAGFKARWSALALAVFTLLATFIFHAYWSVPAEQQMVQQLMFMKNLAITGGLLMVFSFGAGPASLDQRSGAAAKLATA
ncbi:MAG: DoxX family protein [Rubrivivax sp.]|nr:DoxX family protein [Rubrivivax sp.]